MFEEFVPRKKIGFLSPLPVIDNQPYEFYRLAPPGVMLVLTPVGLAEFSKEDVERVYEPVDRLVDMLKEREVDIVIMGGVPLPVLIGVAAHDRLLERMAARAGVPAISQITSVVAALRHLDVRNVALANKWSETMNASLGEFLARDGIKVAGVASRSMAPKDFQRMSTENSMELAYELGREALESLPQADGLYIGGGAWLSLPVTQRLEAEFGKPVVCNQSAMQWNVLHLLDVWQPLPGHGRLLGSD